MRAFEATTSYYKTAPSEPRLLIDFTQPWVLGYKFSHPEFDFSSGPTAIDICPSRDVYRHPQRQQTPVQPFKKLHDIYALGVVLLKIGMYNGLNALGEMGDDQMISSPLNAYGRKYLASGNQL